MDSARFISELRESNRDNFYITCNGKIVQSHEEIKEGNVYRIVPRVLGGKGGFGSMLRAIGAQIDKTNNREACRDLSGRRMRDVNNEKQLKEWVAKQADKEKEREEKRKERQERRRAVPNHKFDDPLYDKQRAVVAENQEDALQIGLQRAQSKQKVSCTITSEEAGPSGSGMKRKSEAKGGPCQKATKHNEWLGIDIDNLSDLDSDEESDSSKSEKSSEDQSVSSDGCQKQTETVSSDVTANITPETEVKHDSEVNMEDSEQKPTESHGEPQEENSAGCQGDNGGQSSSSSNVSESVKGSTESVKETQEDKPFDFGDYSSASDLEALGLEKLKSLLTERGMKCGGTLQQRAERLFSVKGLHPKDIDPSLLAKPSNGKGKGKK